MSGRYEILDQTPVEVPLKLRGGDSLTQLIKEHIRNQFSSLAQSQGYDSFDEDQDFDTGEDEDMKSPYEIYEEHEDTLFTSNPSGIAEKAAGGAESPAHVVSEVRGAGPTPAPSSLAPQGGDKASSSPPVGQAGAVGPG